MALVPDLVVITNKLDTTADLVILQAERHGFSCFRMNTEDLLQATSTCHINSDATPRYTFRRQSQEFCVHGARGIWYRRPEPPTRSYWDLATQEFVAAQWQDFVEGMESVESLRWLNRPSAIRRAENKVLQLVSAEQLGLDVPPTCITSDLREFAAFRSRHGRIVAKTLACGLIEDDLTTRFAYTVEVTETNAPAAEDLSASPVVFQKLLANADHYRVTVVGEQVFAAQIIQTSTELVDWRLSAEPPLLTATELPIQIATSAKALVRHTGLSFASMDLVCEGNRWYFLDLNPNGEWAWIERATEAPISTAIVRYLCDPSA